MRQGLGVLLLACSGCFLSPVEARPDGGADAGTTCGVARESGDAGPKFALSVTLCPKAAPLFLDLSVFTVWAEDGGAVSIWDSPDTSCDDCPRVTIVDPFLGVSEVAPGEVRTLSYEIDGLTGADAGVCPGTASWCSIRTPRPAGRYAARFCISRSATRGGGGQPIGLGPLECVDRPFVVPFNVRGVNAAFE